MSVGHAADCSSAVWLLRVLLCCSRVLCLHPLRFWDQGSAMQGLCRVDDVIVWLWSQPAWVFSLSATQQLGDLGQVIEFN